MAIYDAYGFQVDYIANVLKYDPDQFRQELAERMDSKAGYKDSNVYDTLNRHDNELAKLELKIQIGFRLRDDDSNEIGDYALLRLRLKSNKVMVLEHFSALIKLV